MNTFTFDGSRKISRGRLRQQYAQFTDERFLFIGRKGEELLGGRQAKLGLKKAARIDLLDEFKEPTSNLVESVRKKFPEVASRVGEVVGDAKAKVIDPAGEANAHGYQDAPPLKGNATNFATRRPCKMLLTGLTVEFAAGFFILRQA